MSIRGRTINIGLPPQPNKDIEGFEAFLPAYSDIRNGFLTDAGNWNKRPGFAEKWDLSSDKPVDLLIPVGVGYAVTEDGYIYRLDTQAQLSGGNLAGTARPQYDQQNDDIIIVDGGPPIKVRDNEVSLLGGDPPLAKYVARISSYCIMCGHDATEVRFSASGNHENWPAANFFNVKKTGELIVNVLSFKGYLYFFKSRSIEPWMPRYSATTTFVRNDGSLIEKGCGAGDSVVQANDTFYWYGHDGDFYGLMGNIPKIISRAYRVEIGKLTNPSEIYGFDCRDENKIRWIAGSDGKCFCYDYKHHIFFEDNTWDHGQWERMPMASYMEFDNKKYFGNYDCDSKVFELSTDHENDNGKPIRVFRRFFLPLSKTGRSARVNKLRFRVKSGVATSSVTAPVFELRYRFDRGAWSKLQQISLGAVGEYNPYTDVYALGAGREIEIEIIETSATDFLLTDLWITIQELQV